MARAPVAAFFGWVIGATFLAVGLALLGWVGLNHVELARAFDVAAWVARFAPPEWGVDRYRFGNWAINHLWVIGLPGAFLAVVGFVLLLSARRNSRPIDVSDDGRFRLAFRSMPRRVGRRLEGAIFLLEDAHAGAGYKVELECVYRRAGEGTSTVAVHLQEARIEAARGPQDLHLPFSFDVPITAPPTFGSGFAGFPLRHHWRIHVQGENAWFASRFDFEMEPPTEEEIRAQGHVPAAGSDGWLLPLTRPVGFEAVMARPAPWVAAPSVVKPADLIRKQRAAWNVVKWLLLALVIVHAGSFVAREFLGSA